MNAGDEHASQFAIMTSRDIDIVTGRDVDADTSQAPVQDAVADVNVESQPKAEQTSEQVDVAPFAELVVGANLTFDLTTASATVAVNATIAHVYQPFTMSAVLRVRITQAQNANLPAEAILKLYDRRLLNNIREGRRPPAPWSLDKDRVYAQWLQDIADGKTEPIDFDDTGGEFTFRFDDLTGGALEAYLHHIALKMHRKEVAAYAILAPLQGDVVPQLYGTVAYRESSTPAQAQLVPGILLEHVPGPTMRELVATWTARTPRLPDAELARACDAAVGAVERLAQSDTLINRDVRIDNVIFRGFEDAAGRSPAVVIDFTETFVRDDEPDDDWRQWKEDVDEIGAIGQPLTTKVGTQVGLGIWTHRGILPMVSSEM